MCRLNRKYKEQSVFDLLLLNSCLFDLSIFYQKIDKCKGEKQKTARVAIHRLLKINDRLKKKNILLNIKIKISKMLKEKMNTGARFM